MREPTAEDRFVDTSRGPLHADFGSGGRGLRIKAGGRSEYESVDGPDSLTDFLSSVAALPEDEASEVARVIIADWHPQESGRKTGVVFVDVGWHRRTLAYRGLAPSDEAEVIAGWNVEDKTNPMRLMVTRGFEDLDEAITWARERARLVLVSLGPTEDKMYSAGERLATRERPEEGGTDLTPYAEWPPPDWA